MPLHCLIMGVVGSLWAPDRIQTRPKIWSYSGRRLEITGCRDRMKASDWLIVNLGTVKQSFGERLRLKQTYMGSI